MFLAVSIIFFYL